MAKNLKINIKNTQIAEAINLSGLKGKLAKKKDEAAEEKKALAPKSDPIKEAKPESQELPKEDAPRIRARSKSAFAEPYSEPLSKQPSEIPLPSSAFPEPPVKKSLISEMEEEISRPKTSAELREEIFGESEPLPAKLKKPQEPELKLSEQVPPPEKPSLPPVKAEEPTIQEDRVRSPLPSPKAVATPAALPAAPLAKPVDKLGPTGRHMRDYYKPKAPSTMASRTPPPAAGVPLAKEAGIDAKDKLKPKHGKPGTVELAKTAVDDQAGKGVKSSKVKEFRDIKPARRQETKQFDARDRQGLRTSEDDQHRRKRRSKAAKYQQQEDLTIRPSSLKIRLPISIKDLASEMKLKASQLIGKLFLQGVVMTLNDILEDETTIQLLGQEFGCEISIDTAEEKRIRITDKTIKEELQQTPSELLEIRPTVVAFMGHVDHGKTSLIDAIRASNRAAGEAGAITQHIGAFRCKTSVGDITILDTPGHEAFSAMRARGAEVTDIVVLVVAGDEGVKQQTLEAIQHALLANVTIVVAINKADKPNFNAENVYRQLSENNLLPESWGGQTITVNCSAVTGQGIPQLLEMLALQAEILELRANPQSRARGTVLESEMHKGLGAVATVLVQNGTLRKGDAVVFGQLFGRVKTMHDEYNKELEEAGPSTPVEITGLSGLPEAGQEFIVVKSEKEAKEIAGARYEGVRQSTLLMQQKRKPSMESLFQQASTTGKKVLNLVLRADVQGSLEALKVALQKIDSDKVDLNVIFGGVGEVSESDVQLAAASKAVIIGFHTQIESHAEQIVKQLGVHVRLHDIIYHAVDDAKVLMAGMLDKIALETEKGKAIVKAMFKSSQTGMIAGCQVTEGSIHRSNHLRLRRGEEIVWKGTISSLKRVKEDVREVQKGLECGILLNNFSDVLVGDILEAYEITYITQQL